MVSTSMFSSVVPSISRSDHFALQTCRNFAALCDQAGTFIPEE